MNNNLIMLQRQTMPSFEVEIYIPLRRLKPRCPVFYSFLWFPYWQSL